MARAPRALGILVFVVAAGCGREDIPLDASAATAADANRDPAGTDGGVDQPTGDGSERPADLAADAPVDLAPPDAATPDAPADGGTIVAATDPVPARPRFTALEAPATFVHRPFEETMLLAHLSGEGRDPASTAPVTLRLARDGKRVDLRFTNRLSVGDVAVGDGVVGIDFALEALPAGQYQLCASSDGVDDLACAAFAVEALPATPCQEAFMRAKAAFPAFGCRCATARVKYRPDESPDGTLATFSDPDAPPGGNGGNTLGPVDYGRVCGVAVSSYVKFEPHFTVEILNDPGRPAECTLEEWQRLAIGLCSEGQEINKTHVIHMGRPDEQRLSNDNTTGVEVPYDPRPQAKLVRDAWGYVSPSRVAQPPVNGWIKAHDPPNIVHWLDAPGLHHSRADLGVWAPSRKDHYFHTFVHGTTGRPEDDCDCYFSVTSIVLNADASVGPSMMGTPTCNK